MRTIDRPEALDLLRRAVAKKGSDYIYTTPSGVMAGAGATCSYFDDGEPGCIVGHALAEVGIKAEDLEHEVDGEEVFYNEGLSIENPELIAHLRDVCNLTITPAAQRSLLRAQSCQDRGMSWGRSLNFAEQEP